MDACLALFEIVELGEWLRFGFGGLLRLVAGWLGIFVFVLGLGLVWPRRKGKGSVDCAGFFQSGLGNGAGGSASCGWLSHEDGGCDRCGLWVVWWDDTSRRSIAMVMENGWRRGP